MWCHQRTFARKGKSVKRFFKSLYGTRDASQVFSTYMEEGLNEHGLRETVVPCLHWRDDIIFGFPDDRAHDLKHA